MQASFRIFWPWIGTNATKWIILLLRFCASVEHTDPSFICCLKMSNVNIFYKTWSITMGCFLFPNFSRATCPFCSVQFRGSFPMNLSKKLKSCSGKTIFHSFSACSSASFFINIGLEAVCHLLGLNPVCIGMFVSIASNLSSDSGLLLSTQHCASFCWRKMFFFWLLPVLLRATQINPFWLILFFFFLVMVIGEKYCCMLHHSLWKEYLPPHLAYCKA